MSPGVGSVLLGSLLSRGGPVMYVLLALSVLATAIILLKAFQFLRLRLVRVDDIERLLTQLGPGRPEPLEALQARVRGSRHPVARTLGASLAAACDESIGPAGADAEVSRVGSDEIRRLETWLRGLSAIAHLSPLLGLLGTVLGMIGAFIAVERAGSAVDPALLSGGIWEALLTTAFGLTIAIPSMAALYVFEGEVDRIRAAMKSASVLALARLGKLGDDPAVVEVRRREEYDFAV